VAGECRGVKTCPEGNFCSRVTGECAIGETTTTTTLSTTTTSTTTTLPTCGDGAVSGGEECDDGDAVWDFGEPCNAQCVRVACANPDDDVNDKISATDSLIALRTAVGAEHCVPCICDIDSSGAVTATDALALLRGAVNLPVTISCPECPQ
jgi:cysteine-rich repeat protein